jgi:diguanylate cyclase (GGDEF)-like protein
MRSFDAPRPHGLLVLIDIDRFKDVNDSYGHPAGDEVIRCIATALAEVFSGPGIAIGRLGGEEFAVLLPQGEAGRQPLLQRVEQARRAVAALRFTAAPIVVTISAGVAEAPATGPAREAFAAADRALYVAKRGGRNRVVAAWDRPGRAAA